jgi:hypothetical protein
MNAVNAAAWRRGVVLAMELLEHADNETCGMDDEFRPGRPQYDVVGAYLVRAKRDPVTLAAFTAVLSDFISSVQDGGIPDPDFYPRFLDVPAQMPVLTESEAV